MNSLDGWTALDVSDGLNGSQMVSIDEYNGAIAVGSGLAGAFYYYYGSDPFDKSDDSVVHYYLDQSNFRYRIISDVVRVVRFSPKGELWVGTNYGISRFDLGFESFVNVDLPAGLGPDITAIEFDSRGNVWIGARNGLGRVDYLNGDISVYTTDNSGLLDNHVSNLTFDDQTGDLYVSTSSGLSVVLSTTGLPTDDITAAYAFPNPYVIQSSNDLLNFNFSGNARLRVFTVAGELVAERPTPVWDGRNSAGVTVASGVYLYVLTDDEGNTGRGKFLLVRQ
jgi:ligand-binding sensor domain-containing protein